MLKNNDDALPLMVGRLNFSIPLDGIGSPYIYKVEKGQTGCHKAKLLDFNYDNLERMKGILHSLSVNVHQMEAALAKDLQTYQQYIEDGVRLVSNIDDAANNNEYEMYNLHQKLSTQYPKGINLKMTDEAICEMMKSKGVRLYPKAKDIPEGPQHDECREYLKAYNRIAAKKHRMKKGQKVREPKNITFIPNTEVKPTQQMTIPPNVSVPQYYYSPPYSPVTSTSGSGSPTYQTSCPIYTPKNYNIHTLNQSQWISPHNFELLNPI